MIFPAEKQTFEMIEEAMDYLRTKDEKMATQKEVFSANRKNTVISTRKFCKRAGITEADLESLSVIHITGTKGKGSTGALTERVLASHGYKTGFLISPHLQEVRERIRINCKPMSAEKFTRYFWQVYNDIVTDEMNADLPYPVQLYTIMALKVFIEEKVDVVILEVGIGGEYDHTNIIKHPIVCAVTSLGIDHVEMLGDTIPKIAWHKGGIFKPGAVAFTVPQSDDGLSVLLDRSYERQCPLYLVPAYDQYRWRDGPVKVGIAGKMQQWNASLAVQMTRAWMERRDIDLETRLQGSKDSCKLTPEEIPTAPRLIIDEDTESGIKNCWFPGRHQIIRKEDTVYYLDCAHTVESMQDCAEWYRERRETDVATISGGVKRLMIYNLFDMRPMEQLLPPFAEIDFDGVVFCPNMKDEQEFNRNPRHAENAMEKCWYNHAVWRSLTKLKHEEPTHVCENMLQAMEWCHQRKQDSSLLQILILGGTGIVGRALQVLDPDMNEYDPEL